MISGLWIRFPTLSSDEQQGKQQSDSEEGHQMGSGGTMAMSSEMDQILGDSEGLLHSARRAVEWIGALSEELQKVQVLDGRLESCRREENPSSRQLET